MSADTFVLDPRLAASSVLLADGPLSQIRLVDDSRFPWLLLVPRVARASQWLDLDGGRQRLLLGEINRTGALLQAEPGVERLNIGALGNIVHQLHVHLVGRHNGDDAWPGPIWGSGPARRYTPRARRACVAHWQHQLA